MHFRRGHRTCTGITGKAAKQRRKDQKRKCMRTAVRINKKNLVRFYYEETLRLSSVASGSDVKQKQTRRPRKHRKHNPNPHGAKQVLPHHTQCRPYNPGSPRTNRKSIARTHSEKKTPCTRNGAHSTHLSKPLFAPPRATADGKHHTTRFCRHPTVLNSRLRNLFVPPS